MPRYGPIFDDTEEVRRRLWAPIYEAVLTILGSTGTIIPMGDTNDEPADRTTVTSRGDVQGVWTYTPGAVTVFDQGPAFEGPGYIPVIAFNGASEALTTPDVAYYTRGNGTTDSAFSVGVWANVTDTAAARTFFSKWQGAAANEWTFYVDASDLLILDLQDESVDIDTLRTSDAAIAMGAWRLFVATYDGTGGATAANGIILYSNGATIASTATNNASYVAMEDTAATPAIGMVADPASYYQGSLAGGPLSPFFVQAVLSADAILRLYQLGRPGLGV